MPVPGFTRENLRRHRLTRGPVVVGIPMTEMVSRTAFWNFAFLFRDGMKHGDAIIPVIKIAVPAEARNDMIRKFLNDWDEKYRFLLMFDSDMIVPLEAIDALTGYDVPFVSGYTTLKNYPYTPIPSVKAESSIEDGEVVQGYRAITNWEPSSGIQECDGTGAAALCLRRDLLSAMRDPWFKHGVMGEDYYFCQRVQETKLPGYPDGVPILVSTDIPIGHIGEDVGWPHKWFEVKDQWYADHPDKGETDAEVIGIQQAAD